jgi:hypothetical protein
VDVSGGDDWYYWALQGAWHRGDGVLIVEHDVVPYEGAIETLQECSCDWGGVPYQVGINIDSWLGCAKFSPELMAHHPEVFNQMENTDWNAIDGQLLPYLRIHGERQHIHWPALAHLNDCGESDRVLASCECGGPIRFEQVKNGPGAVQCPRCQGYVSFYPFG